MVMHITITRTRRARCSTARAARDGRAHAAQRRTGASQELPCVADAL
jgi:hypothetical protein